MMRRILNSMITVVVGITAAATVTWGADPGVSVLSSSPDRTVLQFEVDDFQWREVEVNGTAYSAIAWDGGTTRQVRGEPALPSFHTSIVIPDNAEMSARVVSSEYQEYTDIRIVPSKGPITRNVLPQTVRYAFGDVYQADEFYPGEIAGLVEPYIMRDVRGIVVEVNPFQWNPVTGTLRVYTRVVVEVTPIGPGRVNVLTRRPATRVSEFEAIYAHHFVNYGSATGRYEPVGEAGKLLVIAHDSFLAAAQPLVDWRNQMGVETQLVPMSAVGTTGTHLRNYCQASYDNDGMCFYLLVGDGAFIPYLSSGGGAADPILTLCAGGDSYPDAFVGRISGQTVEQVETQIQRIIEYERDPDLSGRWYSRSVSIASNEGYGYGDDGEADWEHARNYRRDQLGFTYTRVDELYDGTHPAPPAGEQMGADEAGNPSTGDLVELVNDGRSMIQYTGHGSETAWSTTGFNNGAINGLVNDNKLPMVVSVGCVNGAFENTTCFAETWMRATHNGEPTGAVACYASTVNQQWATPMRAQDEMIDLLTTNQKRTWGGICFNGSCDMIDHYGSNGISEFKNWTIFGDPSIRIRTSIPTSLAVNHPTVLDPAGSIFEVQTAPGALAALSKDGLYLGAAEANASGLALVPYDSESVSGYETVTLTVTGFNAVPHIGDVALGATTAVADGPGALGLQASTLPNPFRSSTQITFALGQAGQATLEIYDALGRNVRTLETGALSAGRHTLTWDGTSEQGHRVAPGTYYYKLTAGAEVMTRSMVLLQ